MFYMYLALVHIKEMLCYWHDTSKKIIPVTFNDIVNLKISINILKQVLLSVDLLHCKNYT